MQTKYSWFLFLPFLTVVTCRCLGACMVPCSLLQPVQLSTGAAPTGTVTICFMHVHGCGQLLQDIPQAMRAALATLNVSRDQANQCPLPVSTMCTLPVASVVDPLTETRYKMDASACLTAGAAGKLLPGPNHHHAPLPHSLAHPAPCCPPPWHRPAWHAASGVHPAVQAQWISGGAGRRAVPRCLQPPGQRGGMGAGVHRSPAEPGGPLGLGLLRQYTECSHNAGLWSEAIEGGFCHVPRTAAPAVLLGGPRPTVHRG